jgi:hypothetical protein
MTQHRDLKTRVMLLQLLVADFVKTATILDEPGEYDHSRVSFNWDFEKLFRSLY